MTIHASKGKEWPIVFLIDLVSTVLPSPQTPDKEEERRLLYVGITRAENEIHLSYFDKDNTYTEVERSSFWDEMQLPEDNLTEWLRNLNKENKEQDFNNMHNNVKETDAWDYPENYEV